MEEMNGRKRDVPFLSVVVPAYNVENYIKQCVDSILEQSFTDFELLLVDDGSKDNTGSICAGYAAKDDRVRVLHKENGGLVSARKAGITAAKGDYIAYVDGDDWIAPEMFETLCSVAKKESADIVISDFVIAQGENRSFLSQNMDSGCYDRAMLCEQVYPYMLCKNEYFDFGFQPSLCSKIFRKSILLENQLAVKEKIKLGEDAACFYPTILEAERIVYLKEKYFYYYRMRETSISHAIIRSFYTDEILILIEHLQERFGRHKELWPALKGQLWLYACYMFDNMITPCLGIKSLFLTKNLRKEFSVIRNTRVGKEVLAYCKNVRTSSRAKRILGVIEKESFVGKVNLYLFFRYEKMKR